MDLRNQAEQLILSRYDGQMSMLPVIMKSLIHDEVLPALQQSGILKNLVFQGGTALQRFYGNRRFSEDLDFVCGQGKSLKLDPADFESIGPLFEKSVRSALGRKYSLDVDSVEIKQPKDPYALKGQNVNVQVWQLKVPISTQGSKQMVKIEVANVPSYQSEPNIWPVILPPHMNLEPSLTVVLDVETPTEIMADKIVALSCRNHIKHRDIWDYHMLKSQGVSEDQRLIKQKIKDYGINLEMLYASLKQKKAKLSSPELIKKDFWKEMERFVFPGQADQIKKSGLDSTMISSVQAVFQKAMRMVEQELDNELGW